MKKMMILLLVLWGCMTSSVWASTPAKQWGYQPVYAIRAESPTYQFRSTSTCASTLGNSIYVSTDTNTSAGMVGKKIRKNTNPWDITEPPVGEIDTPVGEPYILLLLAFLWIAYKKKRATAK